MKHKSGALGRADTCPERKRGVKSASSSEAKIPRHEGRRRSPTANSPEGAGQASNSTAHRKRAGAPLGNRNAYKHGFYSAAFKAEERRLLEQVPVTDLAAEIELVRVTSYRFIKALNAAARPLDIETQLAALRAVNLSAHSIVSLLRVRAFTAAAAREADALTKTLDGPATNHADLPSPLEGTP